LDRAAPALRAAPVSQMTLFVPHQAFPAGAPRRLAGLSSPIRSALLAALLADVGTAEVPEPMKPLLRYVGKLTLTPAKITGADAEAVLAAGWQEQALHDAVAVCGLFNMMNRLVDGLGITAGQEYFRLASRRLADTGYAGLKDLL
jgi:hypothetical protein